MTIDGKKFMENPVALLRGSPLLYPIQKTILPATNNKDIGGIIRIESEVRNVHNTSCPEKWITSCSNVFRRNLCWNSIKCSPVPLIGSMAVVLNLDEETISIAKTKVMIGKICHRSVYTSLAVRESSPGTLNGATIYPNAMVNTATAIPAPPIPFYSTSFFWQRTHRPIFFSHQGTKSMCKRKIFNFGMLNQRCDARVCLLLFWSKWQVIPPSPEWSQWRIQWTLGLGI